jgi:O-antigen ligase
VIHGSVPAPSRSETQAGAAAGRADAGRLGAAIDFGPGALTALGGVVVLAGTQGGYFPTAWAPSAVVLFALLALWLASGMRTDVGRADLVFLGLLVSFVVWTALSLLWSSSAAQTILEIQRSVALLAGLSAVLVLASRRAYVHVAFALLAGVALVCGYGLATRLFPDEVGLYRPIAGYRLSEPIGYWNGLGIFAAIGALLAVGIALEGKSRWQRVLASVALVVFLPTLYFTFSRGAWLALAVGAGGLLAVSSRRIATLGGLGVLLPAPVLAVLASSQADALTQQRTALAEAVADGRRLALTLAALGALAAGAGGLLIVAEGRVRLPTAVRRTVGTVLLAAVVVVFALTVARLGGPVATVERAYDAFAAPPALATPDLNDRLFSLSGSGRIDLWRVALSSYRSNPVLGSGAGTFERSWQRDEQASFKARDAHSLYLETLAELGPVGLMLLLAAVSVPIVACCAMRRSPVVPAALGAYAAFITHTGFDWDWELPGVTLAGLLAGGVGMIAWRTAPPRSLTVHSRVAVGAGAAAVALLMGAGYVASDSLERAQAALRGGNPGAALTEARRAERWSPWSPAPSTVRGEALLALGDVKAAKQAFREAVRTDVDYWRAWLGLAVASEGRQRTVALRHARSLYPRSIEIAETTELLRRPRS